MRRQRTSGVLAVLGALLVVVLGATAAAAQPPVKEVIQLNDTFVDPFLSEACGVEVTLTVTGRVTHFTFPDRPVGLQELFTVNADVVATAGDNQLRARNVGADVVRVAPDGTVILTTTGQVPFMFTGVLKINLETDEVILEPHHVVDIEEVCAQLTA
jgi:hypothetical protein